MKIRTFVWAGGLCLSGIAVAFAHGGATGIVKERMDAMGAMGDSIKTLSAMMRGETAYDGAAVRLEAEKIRAHGGESMTLLFPEGSSGAPSEAKPEIWSDWDAFEALAKRLEVLAGGLDAAAGNGLMMQGGDQKPGTGMMGGGTGMMGNNSRIMGGGTNMMGNDGSSMMTGNSLMGMGASMPDSEALASMPADGVFHMIVQTCSSCHTKFRLETN